MAIISNVLWQGEPLRATINLDANTKYIVYTGIQDNKTGNFIKDIQFKLSEGNNKVNPLGIATSNSISLQVYDANDYLSPANKQSPYYGKTVNGVRIDLEISFNGVEYIPYGVYYTTSWDGSFNEGTHGLVNISAEDRLITIGNMDLPELPVYANIAINILIAYVMRGIGLTTKEYYIDSSLNQVIPYGIARGKKVRDFLNNVCQILLARVIVDRQGIIRFVPALDLYTDHNTFELDSSKVGSLVNKNNSNINYNKLIVKYLEINDTADTVLLNDNSYVLSVGTNIINDIQFKLKALAIKTVNLTSRGKGSVDSIVYTAYQDGMSLQVLVSGAPITECNLTVTGIGASTIDRSVSTDLGDTTVVGGLPFEFDTQQMMSTDQATSIMNKMKEYLSIVNRNIIMKGSVLSPLLYLGDEIVIHDTDTMYDGHYKVTGISLRIGEDYNCDVTMIRSQ